MRKNTLLTLAVAMFLCSCSETGKKPNQVAGSAIDPSEIFTIELTIGGADDDHSKEFLLADPQIMEVTYTGDILVIDENRIKVFDSQGNEKMIVGRRGEGPGEFGRRFVPYIGPAGYLFAADVGSIGIGNWDYFGISSFSDFYNLFTPDYRLIEKNRIEDNPRIDAYLQEHNLERKNMRRMARFILLDRDKMLFEAVIEETGSDQEAQYYWRVLYDNGRTITHILEKKLLLMYGSTAYPEGEIHWEALPGNRLFYQNADEDVFDVEKGSYYTIHVLSLDNGKDISAAREFTPVEFPERMTTAPARKGNPLDQHKIDKARVFKEKKYYAAVKIIKVEGRYAFLFPNMLSESVQRDPLRVPAEVFDLETCQYVTTIEFPFYPYVIRNGYAYQLKMTTQTEFAEIRKYKIDPAVYGK